MQNYEFKPKKRSRFRIYLGKKYFTLKRHINNLKQRKLYAKKNADGLLPYTVFEHRTPLYRSLKDVDMWYQDHKVINLKQAIPNLDLIYLKPNQIFSYWKLLKKPTKRKGYVDGMILDHGKYRPGIGGGLCQLSNMIYWMTLHSPLTVIERHRHSYDVFPDSKRSQPFGSGATCVYNYRDLKIINNTKDHYQFHFYLTTTHLVGEIRSDVPCLHHYEIYEKDHSMTLEPWGGYMRHNTIYRRTYTQDEVLVLDDEYIVENHALMMYNPLLEYNHEEESSCIKN